MRSTMITLGPVCFAICGFAAVASAFVAPRSHRARFHPLDDGLLAAKQDAETRRSPWDIVSPTEEDDGDGLRQDQFVAELDRSRDEMKSLTLASTIAWKFRGKYDVHCQVSRPGTKRPAAAVKLPAVLLVHGFGCSTVYWRRTIESLTKAGYEVYALDLLGHGRSAKPSADVTYSTRLWARQLDDFCREVLPPDEEVVLVGNSVGSTVALVAAAGDFGNEIPWRLTDPSSANDDRYIREHVAGIGMFNCGIGMNVHSITRDPKWNPAQRYLLDAAFNFMEGGVFGNVALMRWILDNVVTKEDLRSTLLQLYPRAESADEIVDDELVESFYAPAKDPASPEVLSQILTNDAGLTPMEVHSKHGAFLDKVPIHVVWGDKDTVTPVDGIGEVGQLYSALSAEDGNRVTMEVLNGGHVLFDEVPDANQSMITWLNDVIAQKKNQMDFCD